MSPEEVRDAKSQKGSHKGRKGSQKGKKNPKVDKGRQMLMPKSAAFPKPSSRQVDSEDYEDQEDQGWGSWQPADAPWPPYRPTQKENEDRFDEARRYEEPDSTHDPSLDAQWPSYVDTPDMPWRRQQDVADRIPPSQAPNIKQVDPGQSSGLPRGSVSVSMKRQAEGEEETPHRRPHVYGYRQRDREAEAKILHEMDGWNR